MHLSVFVFSLQVCTCFFFLPFRRARHRIFLTLPVGAEPKGNL